MTTKRTPLIIAAVLSVGLLAGCASSSGNDTVSKSDKTITIGVITPLTGEDSARGKGVLHAVELAAAQANDSEALPGWHLNVVSQDDKSEDEPTAQAARALAADPNVAVVVGSIYSGISTIAAPIFAQAGIAQVSPTASNPALTRGADFASHPTRQWPTFFRVCPPDDVYGPSLAGLVAEKGLKRVAVVDDTSDYGKGIVATFSSALEAKGGQIVARASLDPQKRDFASVVEQVKKSQPQAVFFGGLDTEGGPLSLRLKQAGVLVPLVGGDGVYTADYLTMSGALSAGDLAALGGIPATATDKGKQFLADYRAQHYDAPASSESPLGYDAATAAIEALKKAVAADPSATSGTALRPAVLTGLPQVSFDGVGGHVSFNTYGDNNDKTLTFYRVDGGAWAVEKTVTTK